MYMYVCILMRNTCTQYTRGMCPPPFGDGASTFNIPDLRGRTVIGVGKGGAGDTSESSVTQAESTQANASQHELGDYDGSETFVLNPSTFTRRFADRKYCILHNGQSSGDWCRADFNFHTAYAGVETGKFNPATLTSKNSQEQMNMMPYAALNYIIKT